MYLSVAQLVLVANEHVEDGRPPDALLPRTVEDGLRLGRIALPGGSLQQGRVAVCILREPRFPSCLQTTRAAC